MSEPRSACSRSCTHGRSNCSTTLTSTAWSPGAAFPMTAPIGDRRAEPSWFLPRPWPARCAASSGPRSKRNVPNWLLPDAAWFKPWVVHCTPWGEGEQAVLDYLARYVFRVAITNTRIVGLDDQAVTIRHKHRKSNRWRISRIPGQEFMRRFLQHVLPKGLHKVRYFGLWHPVRRKDAARARLLLRLDPQATPLQAQMSAEAAEPPRGPGRAGRNRGSVPAAAKAFSYLSAGSPRSGLRDHDPRTRSPETSSRSSLHGSGMPRTHLLRRRQSSGL